MTDSSLIQEYGAAPNIGHATTPQKLTARANERCSALKVYEGDFTSRWQGQHVAHSEASVDFRDAEVTKLNNEKRFAEYRLPVPAEVAAADKAAIETSRRVRERAMDGLTFITSLSSSTRDARQAVDRFVGWLEEPLSDVDAAGMKDDLHPKQGVAEEREIQSAIRTEAKKVKLARLGVEADLAAFGTGLDKQASEPDYEILMTGGQVAVRFPIIATGGEPRNGDVPNAPNFLPGYIRQNRKRIMADAKKFLDDFYTFENVLVLSDAEKRARLTALAADLLASERREAEYVWRGLTQGEDMTFRPDMDPRAILGTDGPAPPRKRR